MIILQNTGMGKNWESLFPLRLGTKEQLHQTELLEPRTWLRVGSLVAKRFFALTSKSVENVGKSEEGCCNPKDLYLQSTAGMEFSKKNMYRELEAEVKNAIERHHDGNTIDLLRAMASLSMSIWVLWMKNMINFACIVPEFSKNSIFSKTTKFFPTKL